MRFVLGLILGAALMAGVSAQARNTLPQAPITIRVVSTRVDRLCRVLDYSNLETTKPRAFATACPAEVRQVIP